MSVSSTSIIAELLCFKTLPLNLAKLIGEVDALLEPMAAAPFKVSWDCDTVATFDQPGTRVLLAWTDHPGQGLSGVLTLSVGPSPVLGKPVLRPDHAALATVLADHLQSRVGAAGPLWHQIGCTMSADWVDLLLDGLPELTAQHLSGLGRPDLGPDLRPDTAPRAPFGPHPASSVLMAPPPAMRYQTTHSAAERSPLQQRKLEQLRAPLAGDAGHVPARAQPWTARALSCILAPIGLLALAQAAIARL